MAEEKKEEKKGFVAEFMEFLLKYQVIGLAVAFIIGAAATKMVTATVNDIIMPIIGAIIPGEAEDCGHQRFGPIAFWSAICRCDHRFCYHRHGGLPGCQIHDEGDTSKI
jgi:hypothetical protein